MFKTLLQLIFICSAVFSGEASAAVAQKEDPLRPPEYRIKEVSKKVAGVAVKAEPSWSVREIIYSGDRRVAIVNNVVVSSGDMIDGARVLNIKPEHVLLSYKDKKFKSHLRSVTVKKKARINQ